MTAINVSDLPEPLAHAIATMVEALRQQLPRPAPASPVPSELALWQGTVLGKVSREEIYDDVV